MDDLIRRQDVLKLSKDVTLKNGAKHRCVDTTEIRLLPSVQTEIKYRDCANAMLRMWMDNVVTDGEYNRIMVKLNAYWGKDEDEIN